MRITAEPEIGTKNLKLFPLLDDIIDLLCSVFSKILHVFHEIPVIEGMLVPGILHVFEYIYKYKYILILTIQT